MAQKLILTLANVVGADLASHGAPGVGSAPQDIGQLEDLVAELRATEVTDGGTLDVVLEDSFDEGVTWNTWLTFTQLSASGAQVLPTGASPARPPSGLVRARATVGTAGEWDYTVKLAGNVKQ